MVGSKEKVSGRSVAEGIISAITPNERSQATKRLNNYVRDRVAEGKSEKGVRASIKSLVTKITNER